MRTARHKNPQVVPLTQVRKGGGIGRAKRMIDRRIIARGEACGYEVRLHATKGFRVRAA